MKNSFGHLFQIHTFGESHGVALGVVIDGMPAGIPFKGDVLVHDLMRRRPGQWDINANFGTSLRQEPDSPELLSGIYQGVTLGTPIAVIVRNQDQKSEDYHNMPPRQGHADKVWQQKFGHVDPRGGGRSSGRETLSRVIAGSFAKMFVNHIFENIKVTGYSSQIGPFTLSETEKLQVTSSNIDQYVGRFPSPHRQEELKNALLKIKSDGESWGGVAEILISNPPVGLGQPVFHKLKNDLASAMMSVGAVNAVEIGNSSNTYLGTQFHSQTQNYGGIQGGISNGNDIMIRVTFKPTSSILDVAKKGRHDPCIVIRAIPVLEAMTYLVLADHILWQRLDRVEV
jgi:chorismate synthase